MTNSHNAINPPSPPFTKGGSAERGGIWQAISGKVRGVWSNLRRVTGDDAYERYLGHWSAHHAANGAPLDRRAFCKLEQQRKWDGIRRCC